MPWHALLAMLAAPGAPEPKACPLSVRFGSYAMGIDQAAAQRIERFLEHHSHVAAVERHPWGREGEYTLCVRLKPRARARTLFDQLKPLVPSKPRGPIHVVLANGESFGTHRQEPHR
jgi:hypothetical protein